MCSEYQMDQIYNHHPELRSFWATEKDMRLAIAEALPIYESRHGEEFHIYYRRQSGRKGQNSPELKVVVRFDENNVGLLYAVQPIYNRPLGEKVIWPIMSP